VHLSDDAPNDLLGLLVSTPAGDAASTDVRDTGASSSSCSDGASRGGVNRGNSGGGGASSCNISDGGGGYGGEDRAFVASVHTRNNVIVKLLACSPWPSRRGDKKTREGRDVNGFFARAFKERIVRAHPSATGVFIRKLPGRLQIRKLPGRLQRYMIEF